MKLSNNREDPSQLDIFHDIKGMVKEVANNILEVLFVKNLFANALSALFAFLGKPLEPINSVRLLKTLEILSSLPTCAKLLLASTLVAAARMRHSWEMRDKRCIVLVLED